MKNKKLVALLVLILLLFQNNCYAHETVLTGYDEYGSSIMLLLIIVTSVATVCISIDISKKKISALSLIIICVGLMLYAINIYLLLEDIDYRVLDDINYCVLGIIFVIIMIIMCSLLVYFYKKLNFKYFKIIIILAVLFNVLIVPIQKTIAFFAESDIYQYSFSGEDYSKIEDFNSKWKKYQGEQSYDKTKELIESLKDNYEKNMYEYLSIPLVNYIGDNNKYMINEFNYGLIYYASRKNKNKNKNNSLYYMIDSDSDDFQNEYMNYLTDIEEVLREENSYNIEIKEMVCNNRFYGNKIFNIVHVINIVK